MNPKTVLGTIPLMAVACLFSLTSCLGTQAGNGDGPPVTRSEAVLTADRYARVRWTLTQDNQTGYREDRDFKSNYGTGDRIGMAYKWGGWDTVEDFLDKVEKGYGTGTGGGSDVYRRFPKSAVTGISCTGLVSRAWHLNHKYTLNYNKVFFLRREFQDITQDVPGGNLRSDQLGSIKKGDVLINSGHTMVYLYTGRDGRVRVLHSTTPGVIFQSFDVSELVRNGYKPIRYDNIVETEAPKGTATNPIVLTPGENLQSIEGNTRDVVSMEIDEYSSCSAGSQVGPETIYRYDVTRAGEIEIAVTDFKDEGIDNDVFLLRSIDIGEEHEALDCIAWEDRRIEWSAVPGTYWIVVESGEDTPGGFTLSVKGTVD